MGVEEELAKVAPEKDMVLTIGVFDGVHLGHKYLLSQLKECARQENLLSGVVTFGQHPLEVLSPQTRLPYLTNLEQRINLLKSEGVDAIITLSFTLELARLSALEFIGLLKKYLRMRGLVIGPDFILGWNREGNADTLRALGRDMNFSVTVVPPIVIDDEVVSSTAIRKALADGDMKRVHKLVGRFFSLQGRIVSGARRGAGLGFPTANLGVSLVQALPPDGVYATWAHVAGKVYPSATNIGQRPTFGGGERVVEVYLLDYQSDLYGHELKIDIIERLRSEQKFTGAEALKKQVMEDVKRVKTILNSQGRS